MTAAKVRAGAGAAARLGTVRVVASKARKEATGIAAASSRGESGIIEQHEVDLVGELVLDDSPGESARVEERAAEVDVTCGRVGIAGTDVYDDRLGKDGPVEARGAERGTDGRLFACSSSLKGDGAAGRKRGPGGDPERSEAGDGNDGGEEGEDAVHALSGSGDRARAPIPAGAFPRHPALRGRRHRFGWRGCPF